MALDRQVLQEYYEFATETQRLLGPFLKEARDDLKFYAGNMLSAEERAHLQRENRNAYQINKIRRSVNLLSGYEREHRVSTVVGGVDESDDLVAEQLSDVMLYIYDKANAHNVISECFDHSLKTGLGIIGVDMSYVSDKVNGDVRFWWKPYNAVLIDPYFTKRDLSDADRCATRDLLSKDQVKILLPFVNPKDIDALPNNVGDTKFPDYIYNASNTNVASARLVTFDRFWRRIDKKVRLLIDMKSGEEIDVTDFEEEDIQILIFGLKQTAIEDGEEEPDVNVIKTSKPSVELNIVVSNELLYSGPDPTGVDNFPFVPMIPFFEPYLDDFALRIQGVVRTQKDAARLYNRRINQVTDWIESKVNTGWKIVNGAVQDPESLLQTGQGRIIVVNQGHDPTTEVQQLQTPDIPPNVLQYMQMLDKDLLDTSGINEEQLGVADGGNTQVSGRLAEMRASQGVMGTRSIFDAYENSLKGLGNIVLEAIQKNYSSDKVELIINEPPSPDFASTNFAKYDTTIKQAILTRTQRDAYYFELLRLRELGVNIPDSELLKAVPIQSRSRLNELIEANEKAAQEEQKRIQEAEQRNNALSDAALAAQVARSQAETARSKSQTGLLIERLARADENSAQAGLDRAKALTEIESLETDRLLKILQFLQILENPQESQAKLQIGGISNAKKSTPRERSGNVLQEPDGNVGSSEGI